MQTIVYNVNGEGRAISITYVDDEGMMQTEFNVGLPWSKEVSLPASRSAKANITIINIGHDVTCSLTVDGVEVNERTGVGLTVCNTSG
jgi:Mycobacterium membrane protein